MVLEKRKSERSDIFLIVEFKQPDNRKDYSVGVTNNFSLDGFCLDSQRFDFEEGETIECRLKHSDTRLSVTAIGEIVWRRDSWYNCTAGIKFKEAEDNTKDRIAEFIAAVKDKHNGSSSIKDRDPAIAQTDQGKDSSQTSSVDNDILFKAVQAADNEIPGSGEEANSDAECESCKADEERKNGEKAREEAAVKDLPSAEGNNIYHYEEKPSYYEHAQPRDTAGSSEVKKKIYRLYIPIAAFIIIAASAVLYVISGDERGTSVITAPENPDFIQNVYKEPDSATENESQANTTYDQEIAVTARSQNTLIHESKEEASGSDPGVQAKDTNSDKSAAAETGHALQKLIETGDLPTKNGKNEIRDNTAPKTVVPHVPSDMAKKTESIVETRVQPVTVPALPHKDTIIHKDTFSDDTSNWDIFDTSMASASIQNGEYLIENKREKGPHIIFYRYDIPGDSSFVAEASIRPVTDLGDLSYGLVVRSPDNYSYGFVFGAKDAFNNFTFQIRGDGFYSIGKHGNGSMQELANGKIKRTVYNQTGTNVLKIVRKDGILQFYINDAITAEIPNVTFLGSKAGLIVDGELIIAVDNIYTEIR